MLQQSTYWTLSQARVSKALERIRQLVPSHTQGRSRMRESCTYGSGRGARGETRVPTATTPRVHHGACRRGSMAVRGARAAAGDASGRLFEHEVRQERPAYVGRIPSGSE